MFSASDDQNRTAPNHCSSVPENPPYSESSVPGTLTNLSFLHSPVTDALINNTQTQQNHLKLPVTTAILSQGATGACSDMQTTGLGDHVYNYWKDEKHEMLFMQTIGDSISGSNNLLGADDPQMILQAQLGITNGKNLSFLQPNVPIMQNHGLFLSLSTQIPAPSIQCLPACSDLSLSEETFQDKSMHGGGAFSSNLTALILNSKYLNAAQELLNEVANVEKALKKKTDEITRGKTSNPKEIAVNSSGELSPSEKQDLHSKITKLLEMLDEVDRRYKHYYHQMQTIMSYLDMIAGCGAAKPYTSLALQTISCHFRCLRDAISGQIQVARKSLGKPDNSSSMCGGLSRLRGIDQQFRQQRVMQQLGMMQPNAWRPQRGLPESSVSILRAWLFEHFLHPYPNDSEKLMLARQTGLSRSQIANWFINARVRLWKPMIEDMYKEEFGGIEIDSNSSLENPPKAKEDIQSSINAVESVSVSSMNTKISDQRPIEGDSSFLQDPIDNADQSGRFFAYQMTELGQYENNGVSLTLGLPISDNQQSFLALRRNDYSNGDQQQGFLSTHLLHDFV